MRNIILAVILTLTATTAGANSLTDWNSLSPSQRNALEKSARSNNYIWRRTPPGRATVNAYRRYYYYGNSGGAGIHDTLHPNGYNLYEHGGD